MQVTLHEAAAQLSALGKRAWAGERIVITQDGEPYLELLIRKSGSGDFTETSADQSTSRSHCRNSSRNGSITSRMDGSAALEQRNLKMCCHCSTLA